MNKSGFVSGALIGIVAGFSMSVLFCLLEQAQQPKNDSIKRMSRFQNYHIQKLI